MSKRFLSQIQSTVANGTAPLIVASTTAVTNLNADLLDGQHGSYFAPIASPTFTGTVTVPTPVNQTDAATKAYVDSVVIATKTASATLALTDVGDVVEMNLATANTVTVPPFSTVAIPVGSTIDIIQYGAGQTTIVAGAGVTLRSSGNKLKLSGQYSGASLYKRATDEWIVIGDLTA